MAQQSEVAVLRARIEAEYTAAFAALHASSEGSARHAVINARMWRAQQASAELIETVGEGVALPMIADALENATSS